MAYRDSELNRFEERIAWGEADVVDRVRARIDAFELRMIVTFTLCTVTMIALVVAARLSRPVATVASPATSLSCPGAAEVRVDFQGRSIVQCSNRRVPGRRVELYYEFDVDGNGVWLFDGAEGRR